MALSDTIKQHKAATVAVIGAGLAVAAWLAFGVFGIHTAFIDEKVDEAAPVFSSATTVTSAPASDAATTAQPSSTVATASTTPSAPASTAAPAITTVARGTFSGSGDYDVTGEAVVLTDGSEQRFLRFEGFEASNGPDLKVYLRAADGDFVSLGDLKGNIGDQNYEIPVDVDLAAYSTVQIWCERFSANFGEAGLS